MSIHIFDETVELKLISGLVKNLHYLASGFTAEVYKGDYTDTSGQIRPVAVKILHANKIDDQELRKVIEDEALDLQKLNELAQEGMAKYHTFPAYLTKGVYNNLPFIVMEFIQGENLAKDLEEKKTWSEDESLQIAAELFSTLFVLHSELKKTFQDLKTEDLYIQKKEDGSICLRMLDFGALCPLEQNPNPDGLIRHDLLMAGVSFFEIKAGYKLALVDSDNVEPAEEKIDAIPDLTWGTREILKKLLRKIPERRINSSKEASQQISNLLAWKKASAEKLIQYINKNSEEAEKLDKVDEKQEDYVFKVNSMLSFLTTLYPSKSNIYDQIIQRADNLTRGTNLLTIGKALVKNGEFGLAKKRLEKGRDISSTPQVFRHWLYLCESFEKFPKSFIDEQFGSLSSLMEKIESNDWIASINRINEICELNTAINLDILKNSIEMSQVIEKGESAEYVEDVAKSALCFRKAFELWQTMPDRDFIKQFEVGDLQSKAEGYEHKLKKSQIDNEIAADVSEYTDFLDRKDFISAKKKLWTIIRNNYQYTELPGLIVKGIIAGLSDNQVDYAYQIGRYSQYIDQKNQELINYFQLTSMVMDIKTGYLLHNYSELTLSLGEYLERKTTMPRSELFFANWLQKVKSERIFFNRKIFIEQCFDLSNFYGFQDLIVYFQDRLSKLDQYMKNITDEDIVEFDELLHPAYRSQISADLKGCQLARGLSLMEAVQIIHDREERITRAESVMYRLKLKRGMESKIPIMEEMLKKAKNILMTEKSIKMDNQTDQVEESKAIEKAWKIIKEIDTLLTSTDSPDQQELTLSTRKAMPEMVQKIKQRIYKYKMRFSDLPEDMNQIILESDKLSEKYSETWERLQTITLEKSQSLKSQIASLAQRFNAGEDLPQIISELHEIEQYALFLPEWHELKERLLRAEKIQQWEEENSQTLSVPFYNRDLLAQIKALDLSNLPKNQWKGIEQYLMNACGEIRARAKDTLPKKIDRTKLDGYMGTIQEWVELDSTKRLIEKRCITN
jgi:serine/threonine protein kinase